MPLFSLILRGMLLGIGAAAPIGPVNVEIARRTLRGGFSAGFALGFGAVTVDVGYAILVSLSLRNIVIQPAILTTVSILGAALLTFLGISCLRQAKTQSEISTVKSEASSLSQHYITGLLLTSLNPMTLAFWFLGVPATVASLTPNPARDLPWICAGVFVATLGWVCFFTGFMNQARGEGRQRWLKTADIAGGILLLSFAGLTIWRTARGFL